MNSVLSPVRTSSSSPVDANVGAMPRMALLGSGTVGQAFVARYRMLRGAGIALPDLVLLANSRGACDAGGDPSAELARIAALPRREALARPPDVEPMAGGDIVVDATASDDVAACHADWLERGVHVATANKLGSGGELRRALAIEHAIRESGARYGDSATVGAGLPLLKSIRDLVAGGDRIHVIEGVLSGSLAWLFDRFDGMRPFSGFVREARAAGYTEPDPRIDLSGEDVRRKLLLLARAAGVPLEAGRVRVESLVPGALSDAAEHQIDARLPALDAPLRSRYQQAWRDGARLRFVGRFEIDDSGAWHANVGLLALPASHPLCGGSGTDNRVAIHSCRYRVQPLVIQGPGAGADVTAAALLDDVLRIARDTEARGRHRAWSDAGASNASR
jgi:homoserine dehydrogenase